MDYFQNLQNRLGDVYFVVVGAMDGITDDLIYPLVKQYNWSGLLIEPRKDKFELLKKIYNKFSNVKFVNVAIDKDKKNRKLY